MCNKCVLALQKYYPGLTEGEQWEVLMNATAFPFGSSSLIERQLKEVREATDGSFGQAIGYADRQLDAAYKKYKQANKGEGQ